MYKYLYLVLFGFITNCASVKLAGPEKKLIYGSGGGFTGAVVTYSLSSFGKLSRINMKGEIDTTYHLKLKKKQLLQLFNQSDKLKNTYMGFKNPGNMYKFIYLSGELNGNPDYMWGQDKFTAPIAVTDLYDALMKLVPKE